MKRICLGIIFLSLILLVNNCGAEEKTQSVPIAPKKVEMDTNYDGKVDRIELYNPEGQIVRLESDTNGDGVIDEWVVFEKEKPIKKEKDTNADGKADVWVEY